MSLLKNINKSIKEDAVGGSTGAGSIASFTGGMFPGGYINGKVKKKHKVDPIFRTLRAVNEAVNASSKKEFDPQDVDSKMDSAEKRSQMTKNVSVFGIEDELGKVIKVYVNKDQADAFEKELAAMMYKSEDAEEPLDVAEVIYELGKKFDIVDADWGDSVVGDEEQEEVPPAGAANAQGGAGGAPTANADGTPAEPGAEGEAEPGAEGGEDMAATDELGGADTGEATAASALQQVIDMMKADAEAKKAEANARKAEADARTAEAGARASHHKVRQEEEVLDMEAHNDSKDEEKKETKRLAQLARYRHDKAREAEGMLSNEGFRFESKRDLHTVIEIADIIFENLKQQGTKAYK